MTKKFTSVAVDATGRVFDPEGMTIVRVEDATGIIEAIQDLPVERRHQALIHCAEDSSYVQRHHNSVWAMQLNSPLAGLSESLSHVHEHRWVDGAHHYFRDDEHMPTECRICVIRADFKTRFNFLVDDEAMADQT